MSNDDVLRIIADFANKYPPLITIPDAAAIARHDSTGTIYDWSSRKLLDTIKVESGRRVLLLRDGFVRFLLTGTCGC